MKKRLMVFTLGSIFLSQAIFGAVSKSQAPLVSLFQKGSFRTVSKLDDTCAVRMVAFVKNDGQAIGGMRGREATYYMRQELNQALKNGRNVVVLKINSKKRDEKILQNIQTLMEKHNARFFSGLVEYRDKQIRISDTPLTEMQLTECGDLLESLEPFLGKDLAEMRDAEDIDPSCLGAAFLIVAGATLYYVAYAGVIWMAYYIDSLHMPLAL